MQVNPVSQQPAIDPAIQSAAKPTTPQTAQQSAPKADTVILSQQAKDLAAQMAGKGAAEELNESIGAKEIEARNQAVKGNLL